jgi:hypothetical protein
VLRKVGDLGQKVQFESNPDFNMAVKRLSAQSFVPENDVLERFLDLVDSFPDRVKELIAYFEAEAEVMVGVGDLPDIPLRCGTI